MELGIDKKFWATAFTLTGTIIGAGILGLPYVFAQSGIFIGIFWLVSIGLIVMYVCLCLGEVSLRTKGKHQLVGYAEKYLGKGGKRIMFFAVVFGIYSALLAYLIGEGQSLSQLFTGSLNYSFYFAISFWLFMTSILRKGLRGLKRVELWGVFAIIIIILTLAAGYFPEINTQNYFYSDIASFFLPFGVVLFALMGFTSMPELRREIRGSEKKLRKTIIIGVTIPIFLYIIFSLIFIGVLGKNITEVATLNMGWLVLLLGVFTMLTSYFVLSFVLKDIYKYDLKYSSFSDFFLVSFVPLVLYLLISWFDLLNFISVLGIGGVISGGLTGIMVLIISKQAKKKGDRNPEYKMKVSSWLVWLLVFIFALGILAELFF